MRRLLLCVAAAAIAGFAFTMHAHQTRDQHPGADAGAPTHVAVRTAIVAGPELAPPPPPTSPTPPPARRPPTPTSPLARRLDPVAGPLVAADIQAQLDAGSDLPADRRQPLEALARRVVSADLTGIDAAVLAAQFPSYWPTGPADRPTVTDLQILAASASSDAGVQGVVKVTVIWTGRSASTGKPLQDELQLTLGLAGDQWVPLPPG